MAQLETGINSYSVAQVSGDSHSFEVVVTDQQAALAVIGSVEVHDKRGFRQLQPVGAPKLPKMRVVSMGRRNTQLRPTFNENKS